MRVITPRKQSQKRQHHRGRLVIAALLVVALVVGGVAYVSYGKTQNQRSTSVASQNTAIHQNIQTPNKKGVLKTFAGEEFKALYNNFAYPNTQRINEDTPITGDVVADAKIRQIAVQRGYQIRSAPVTNAFKDVGGGYLLQERAAQPWLDMVADAKKDGINLGLTAAYRSADEQKEIFMGRLSQQNINVAAIGTGAFDTQISQVLRMTAVPGYSRHHTGYTIDIACENTPDSSFKFTQCFKWLSANNYEKAKTHGWIPSYPEGTEKQGPDPESWEYVWVGTDAVTE